MLAMCLLTLNLQSQRAEKVKIQPHKLDKKNT